MSVTYEGVDTAVRGAISVRQCSQSLKKAFALKYFGEESGRLYTGTVCRELEPPLE